MHTTISVVTSRFYRAFELIYGRPYNPDLFKEVKRTVHKESLKRTCRDCRERKNCNPYTCPTYITEIDKYANQDWIKRDYREITFSNLTERQRSRLGFE
jgi:hypothetical protein